MIRKNAAVNDKIKLKLYITNGFIKTKMINTIYYIQYIYCFDIKVKYFVYSK